MKAFRNICKVRTRELITGLLLGVFLISGVYPIAVANAAPPAVTTDEAVYVNLDYYGIVEDVSVVKSCSLNGIYRFQDYGVYESVTNMTSYDQPILSTDGVQWDLGDSDLQRFYYSCKVKNDAIVLPWSFDVSYKLNGQPKQAQELAGAAGLVEINIAIKPNAQAKDYYKYNMLLQVATYVNSEDTYSLEAPGSQLQSLGTYKAVLFAALPGEEDTFTIRIGTNSFETKGITMMMIPGTLKQMEELKELKEAKDTVYESADAIYHSMNDLLNTLESTKEGLNLLKSGSEGVEDARQTFSAGKGQMYQYGDKTLEDITAANDQLEKMIPYFKIAKRMTRDLNRDIESMTNSLNQLRTPLGNMGDSAATVEEDLEDLQAMLDTLNDQLGGTLYGMQAVADTATPFEQTGLMGAGQMAGTVMEYDDTIDSLMAETASMAGTLSEITDLTRDLIDETDDLGDTLNNYEDDILDLLDDCRSLTTLLNTSIDSSVAFLTYSKTLLQASADQLDDASAQGLQGLIGVLDKGILGLDSVKNIREANQIVKNTIDREFDKFEKENQFLNLDAKADLISFTSDKNPAPTSIQIILRTKEISLDNGEDHGLDLEFPKEKVGFWARIKELFRRIAEIF